MNVSEQAMPAARDGLEPKVSPEQLQLEKELQVAKDLITQLLDQQEQTSQLQSLLFILQFAEHDFVFNMQFVIHCVSKRDPDIIDCNFKRGWRIFTIFCTNIPDTTGHQMALQVPTSPNICFYTTWGKQNKRNMH